MPASVPPPSQSPPPGASSATPPAALPTWQVGAGRWDFRRPLIMGVLNATPDSFSDGGEYLEVGSAVARAHELAQEGADVIDLGGASSHPKAKPVPAREELERIVPVVERLLREVPLPLSIDTQKPEVAEVCLKLGAHLINDVSGLTDLAMARLTARFDVPLVIMFNTNVAAKGAGRDFLPSMVSFFADRVAQAGAAGCRKLILDPGYGFGKTLEENLTVLRGLGRLQPFRRPVLVCTSRKGSLGRLTGEKNPKQRLGATLATSLYAVRQGSHMIRLHDVKAFHQELLTWHAIESLVVQE